MIETINQYMKRAYGIMLQANPEKDDWKRDHILWPSVKMACGWPTDILTPKDEYACDCIWYAYNKHATERFFRFVEAEATMYAKNKDEQEREYRDAAEKAAAFVTSAVWDVWTAQGRAGLVDKDAADKAVVPAVVDFFIGRAIPCEYPWLVVRACRSSHELRSLLVDIWKNVSDKPRLERRHYYETTVKDAMNKILTPASPVKHLRDTTLRKDFESLAMYGLGLRDNIDEDNEIVPWKIGREIVLKDELTA